MIKEGLLEIFSPCLGDNEIDRFIRELLEIIEVPDEDISFVPAIATVSAPTAPIFQAEEKSFCFKPFGIEQCG